MKKKTEKLLQLPWIQPVEHEDGNETLDLMRAIGDPEMVSRMDRILSGKPKDDETKIEE